MQLFNSLANYYPEFLLIAFVHFLAVASPGPDFAIIVKQSLSHGRQHALLTSVGIGCGILLHVTYSLIGIGLLIASSPTLFSGLTYLAAGYLFYIGIQGIRSKPRPVEQNLASQQITSQSFVKAFATGFLVNGLNVKATLFFVSLFSIVISTTTPLAIKAIYGGYMAVATAAWFALLSTLLTINKVREKLYAKGYIVDRLMGVVLIILAISILG